MSSQQPPSTDAESIPEFCVRNRISMSLYFKIMRAGRGPRIMKIGHRTLISREAAEAWRRKCEAETVQCGEDVA